MKNKTICLKLKTVRSWLDWMETNSAHLQKDLTNHLINDVHFFFFIFHPLIVYDDFTVHIAMLKTTADLVQKFNCASAYTESDEISLIFPSQIQENSLFGGRV